jgi:hypothetical protein
VVSCSEPFKVRLTDSVRRKIEGMEKQTDQVKPVPLAMCVAAAKMGHPDRKEIFDKRLDSLKELYVKLSSQ